MPISRIICGTSAGKGAGKIKIAIIDDDKGDYLSIKQHIERYAAERDIDINMMYFNSGLYFIDKYTPVDLVLMDIDMETMNGISTAKKLREIDHNVLIVFVTNYAGYALQGYSVQAYDFLIKPVTYQMFTILMNRVVRVLGARSDRKEVIVKSGSLIRLDVEDIYYIEVNVHKRVYHTKRGDFFDWGNLSDLERELSPYGLVRAHASYLINLKYVKSVNGSEVIVGDTKLFLSRGKRQEFIAALTEHLKGWGSHI